MILMAPTTLVLKGNAEENCQRTFKEQQYLYDHPQLNTQNSIPDNKCKSIFQKKSKHLSYFKILA